MSATPALFTVLALVVSAPLAHAQSDRPILLVMPLSAEADQKASARSLDALLLQAIHDLEKYQVLAQEDLNALLGVEKMKDAVGCDDISCAAEIGGALGAPFLVAGGLTPLGKQVVLSLRLIDTRKPAVLARATVRGQPSGDELVRMMQEATRLCFGDKPAEAAPAATPATGAQDYTEFGRVMAELGKRMSKAEYTAMLADVDRYEAAVIRSPPNTDIKEYLAYYRFLGCQMLKRAPCMKQAAATYQKRWPNGSYTSAVETGLAQLEDEALAREDATADLQERLAEIAHKRASGTIDARTSAEMTAFAYFSAKRWKKAAELFEAALGHLEGDPEKKVKLVSPYATALQQAGMFKECRTLLEQIKRAHPKEFRREGLHHTLRHLPR